MAFLSWRNMLRVVLLSFMALLTYGCFGIGESGKTDTTQVRIGALLPLTGTLSRMGGGMSAAIEVGITDINNHLKANGSQIRLVVTTADTETDPDIALMRLKEMYADGIRIVIGPGSSSEAAAVLDYANTHGILLISNCTAPSLAIAGDNLLRLAPSDTNQAAGIAMLMDNEGIEQLITVNRNDNYGNELASALQTSFTALGGATYGSLTYSSDATDFTALIAQIKVLSDAAVATHGAAHVAVQLTSMEEAKDILAAANGTTLSQVKWFGSDGNANHSVILADGDAAAFAAAVSFRSPIFTVDEASLGMPKKVLPDRSLRQKIYSAYGAVTDTTSLIGYDAAWLIGLALEQDGKDASASTLIDTIFELTTTTEPGLAGASGRLELTSAGDKEDSGYSFYEVTDVNTSEITSAYTFSGVTPQIIAITDTPVTIPAVSGNVIKIGALISLTGGLSQAGLSAQAGLLEAVNSINSYFEFYGSDNRVELVVKDTGTDPAQAVGKLTELHNEGVEMVVGPISSEVAATVLPQLGAYGMVMISPASTAASLAVAGDNLYRFILSDSNMASALAMLLTQDGKTSVVTITRNDTWGTGLSNSFDTAFTGFGGSVEADITYDPATTSFATVLNNANTAAATSIGLHGAGSTAVILFSYEEGITILSGAADYASLSAVSWYGGDGMAKNETLFDDSAAASFASAHDFTCAIYSILEVGGKTVPDPISRQVVADSIKNRLGFNPITHAYMSWDALWVSALTYAAYVNNTDVAATLGGQLTTETLKYIGLSNFMALNANGDRRFGEYGFFTVDGASGGYTWDLTATYHYTPIDYAVPAITRP